MKIPNSVYEAMGMEIPKGTKPKQTTVKAIILQQASKETPIFMRVTGRDLVNTLVACTSKETVTFEVDKWTTRNAECARMWVLEGDFKAERRTIELAEMYIHETLEPTEELIALYTGTVNSVKVKIWTYVYPEVNVEGLTSYEMYCLNVKPIAMFEYEPEGVHTIDEAEEWVIKNHPSEYIGMGCKTTNGAFMMGAIPQAYSDDGKWASRKGREEITRQAAEKCGYVIGKFDYTDADKAIEINQ